MAEEKTVTGLPVNTEAALAYVFLWVSGILFLLLEKDDKFIRFHALQSIVVFGAITVATMIPIIGWMLSPLLWVGAFILWLVLIMKAYKGEKYMLPVVGEFVEKQLEKMSK
jgi:uncharacterized membrane protein